MTYRLQRQTVRALLGVADASLWLADALIRRMRVQLTGK